MWGNILLNKNESGLEFNIGQSMAGKLWIDKRFKKILYKMLQILNVWFYLPCFEKLIKCEIKWEYIKISSLKYFLGSSTLGKSLAYKPKLICRDMEYAF